MARIWVAMSGGVDSSVSAALLAEEGHEVTGVTMKLVSPDASAGECRAEAAARDAARVCEAIDIPHEVVELRDEFRRRVVETYLDGRAAGTTPNPCIRCNDEIKFGLLLEHALEAGANLLATGHYARVGQDAHGPRLARAAHAPKDQSYFLYRLGRKRLECVVFPLGELDKASVRAMAAERGLPVTGADESQDACFFGPGGPRALLEAERPGALEPGPVVDPDDQRVGTHRGVGVCTIGQRKGFGHAPDGPWYVTGVDAGANCIRVGPAEALDTLTVRVSDATFDVDAEDTLAAWEGVPLTCKVRSRGPEVACTIERSGPEATITLETPVRGAAPGQAAVCYAGELVVGGGTIAGSA